MLFEVKGIKCDGTERKKEVCGGSFGDVLLRPPVGWGVLSVQGQMVQ